MKKYKVNITSVDKITPKYDKPYTNVRFEMENGLREGKKNIIYKEMPTVNSVASNLAKKLKQPIAKIKRNKTLVNQAYKMKLDEFINGFVEHYSFGFIHNVLNKKDEQRPFWSHSSQINFHETNPIWIWSGFYDEKTNCIKISLHYKNAIKSFQKQYAHLKGRVPIENWKQVPKYIRYWMTESGEKEIKFIEKSLESIGKCKFEIYRKNGNKFKDVYIEFTRSDKFLNKLHKSISD